MPPILITVIFRFKYNITKSNKSVHKNGLISSEKVYKEKIRISAAAETPLAIFLSISHSLSVYPIKFPKIFQLGTLTERQSHVWHTPRAANVPCGRGGDGRREKHLKHLMGCLENVINCQSVGVSAMNTCICERLLYGCVYACACALKHFSLSSAISRENFT